MKTRTYVRIVRVVCIIAGLMLLFACGGSSSGSGEGVSAPRTAPRYIADPGGGIAPTGGTGTLRVLLTDAPDPTIDSAMVTISEVTVHTTGGAWFSVMSGSKTLDLLDLQNGVTDLLGEVDLEAGKYTQIRFSVDAGTVVSGGVSYPVEVPSGEIKLNRNIDVCEGGDVEVVVDFDAQKSLKYNKGQDVFKLQPVVKIEKVDSECPPDGAGGGDGDPDGEYEGTLGWFSIVLPPVAVEDFQSLTALIDDIQVHDQGIGQVTTFLSSYTADLLEDARQVTDPETGEVLYTVLVPPVEIPAGTLDQIRLLFDSIDATGAGGNSITIALPSGGEGDGLKFFGAFEVCEDSLTVLRWDLALSAMALGPHAMDTITVHPEIHGPTLLSVCEPYAP